MMPAEPSLRALVSDHCFAEPASVEVKSVWDAERARWIGRTPHVDPPHRLRSKLRWNDVLRAVRRVGKPRRSVGGEHGGKMFDLPDLPCATLDGALGQAAAAAHRRKARR